MKRDGASVPVEVSDDLAHATIAGRTYDVRLVTDASGRVELEIAGEQVVVGPWPSACLTPPSSLEVNGESWPVELQASGGPGAGARRPAGPTAPLGTPGAAPSDGVAVLPPMPGRIIEVRVKEGDRVAKGAVLLVLEAMKMRNEVTAPTAGLVRGLAVREGTNVRAREPMLRILTE